MALSELKEKITTDKTSSCSAVVESVLSYATLRLWCTIFSNAIKMILPVKLHTDDETVVSIKYRY